MEAAEFYLDLYLRGTTRVEGDSARPGSIDVKDWSWGLDLPDDTDGARWSLGQGSGATNRAEARELTLKKRLDKSSTALMSGAIAHTLYDKAVLKLQQKKDESVKVTFTMEKVRITKYEVEVSDHGGEVEETLTLDFQRMTLDYKHRTLTRGRPGQKSETSQMQVLNQQFTMSTIDETDA